VAKPHKKSGRSIQVTSTLPADQLASLCKEAADQCKGTVRLEEAIPGKLVFTIRNRGGSLQYMTFEVRLAAAGGKQTLTSRIARYKTRQQKFWFFIPAGRKRMISLSIYEQFMSRFSQLVRHADPQASVTVTG
jgi:hypothetical protein